MSSAASDALLFKCPKCKWWMGAIKPAELLTTQQLHEATVDLKCTPDCGWEGRLTGRDAFPLAYPSARVSNV